MERFIEVNTQKLAENKYLCPLSGKKFKGPDFVRKHIFNKHNDKVNAVRQEVSTYVLTYKYVCVVRSFCCHQIIKSRGRPALKCL